MSDGASDSDDGNVISIFDEPSGYFQPEKPYTFESFTLDNGTNLELRLVGQNPLWGHLLWNGARVLSTYLQQPTHVQSLVHGRTVLELGAGAGLPSLVCAALGATIVIVTDYPDAALIENLRWNIAHCALSKDGTVDGNVRKALVVAEPYLWGASADHLTAHLAPTSPPSATNTVNASSGFDTLILADLLFNHSEHAKLVRSMRTLLARRASARVLVFFTPYRPWLLQKDLAFFETVAKSNEISDDGTHGVDLGRTVEGRLGVRKLFEKVLDEVMFEEDPGDEKLRRTVYGYEILWADLQGDNTAG